MAKRLTAAQIEGVLKQLVVKQKNRCAICGHAFTGRDKAVLDHDHDTGYIRGALHNSCNGTEGRVKAIGHRGHKGVTSGEYIIGLGKYLDEHKKPHYPLLHPTHLTEREKMDKRNKKARDARARKKAK